MEMRILAEDTLKPVVNRAPLYWDLPQECLQVSKIRGGRPLAGPAGEEGNYAGENPYLRVPAAVVFDAQIEERRRAIRTASLVSGRSVFRKSNQPSDLSSGVETLALRNG